MLGVALHSAAKRSVDFSGPKSFTPTPSCAGVEIAETAWKGLRLFEATKADFADCVIERKADAAGCEHVVSFDKKASRAQMVLLQ
jgi:hypothetical protein